MDVLFLQIPFLFNIAAPMLIFLFFKCMWKCVLFLIRFPDASKLSTLAKALIWQWRNKFREIRTFLTSKKTEWLIKSDVSKMSHYALCVTLGLLLINIFIRYIWRCICLLITALEALNFIRICKTINLRVMWN